MYRSIASVYGSWNLVRSFTRGVESSGDRQSDKMTLCQGSSTGGLARRPESCMWSQELQSAQSTCVQCHAAMHGALHCRGWCPISHSLRENRYFRRVLHSPHRRYEGELGTYSADSRERITRVLQK